MIKAGVPINEQCILIKNVIAGKSGIYFNCPPRFSSNTQTFMLNYLDKSRQLFPIYIAIKACIKTTNMKLNGEKPPYSISQLIYKRYQEKQLEDSAILKRILIAKSKSYHDLESLYN
jgi:hypothetical protein